jgi:uncharacterized protein (TIGR00369 family)
VVDEPVRGRLPDPSFWSLSGIDQARARLRGLVPRPPLVHLIGLRLTQVGAGSATVTMPATPWLQNVDGAVDVRTLLEETLAMAVTTGAPAGHEVRTTALSVNVLRHSGVEGETFVGRARTLNSGSLFTLAEAQVEDAAGRAVAHATGSFLIRPLEAPPPSSPSGVEPVEEPVYSSPDPHLRPMLGKIDTEFLAEHDGLTIARSHLAGQTPIPLSDLLGARLIDADPGTVSWTMPATEWFCALSREVAPGVVATLAHCGLGAAVTVVPAGHRVGTVEQSITLLRPVPPDGRELACRGVVVHQAGELIVSTVEVTDADGNRVALGYQTSVLSKRPSRRSSREAQRVLATVLFTDIVGSTVHAEHLGDSRWSELLDEHHAVVRRQLTLFRGREIKTTGDGFLATFDSPGRGVQAARAIRDAVRRLGVELRAGLHTGECEVSGADVTGIAVHIAARVQACAGDGEVLVTSTVRDLVVGSGLRFGDRGRHVLKGIEGDWQLFAVAE